MRILVTGSREWIDRLRIRQALLREFEHIAEHVELADVTVVHGAQGTYRNGRLLKGADMMADEEATALRMNTEPHPASWWAPCRASCKHGPRKLNRWGRDYCQWAGFDRNQEMVNLGADVCLAFPIGRSPGTRDCVKRARLAGIRVIDCSQPLTVTG